MTSADVTNSARPELLGLQSRAGGWGYRRGSPPCSEPTAMAGLALLSAPDARPSGDAAHAAAAWLATVQQPDGSVGVSADVPEPGWATPLAMLLWSATGGHDDRLRAATRWLLARKGRTLSKADDPYQIAGHDTTLVGWPWVADTHSWLEPTATAVLALGRAGLAAHPRVTEGLRLIRDRQVESGGWNYGNKSVFGRSLRPQPAPTGLALLALSGTGPRSEEVERAIRYLRAVLPGVRASASLGWGLIGLRAWGERPEGSDGWLAGSLASATGRTDAAPKLACLLLAAGADTLKLFGRSDTPGAAGNVRGSL